MTLEQVIPFLVGVVGFPVINFLKAQFNLSGKPAVYLTVAVSVVLAAAALAITGGLNGDDLLANVTVVFSTATLLYKLLPSAVSDFGA